MDIDHWTYTDGVWLNEAVLRGLLDMNIGVTVYLFRAQVEKAQWSKTYHVTLLINGDLLSPIHCSINNSSQLSINKSMASFLFFLAFAVLLSFMNGFFIGFHSSKFIKYLDELSVYGSCKSWKQELVMSFTIALTDQTFLSCTLNPFHALCHL